MDKDIDKRIADYLNVIKKKYPRFEFAYLFGSYTKGRLTEDSDIDIALIFRDLEDSNRFDLQVQLMLIAANIDIRIEPHPISKSDFDSGNPFVVEIKTTGIEFAA